MKQWWENNPEYLKEWRKDNPKKIKKIRKRNYINNREKELKNAKHYRENNPEKRKKICKQWWENNPEYMKNWREKNSKHCKQHQNKYHNNKYKTDLKFNLNNKISSNIYISLKNNKVGRHWEDLVGYKLEELINYLDKTIPKGYTWQDFLEGKLQIDHIIPISVFNFTKPEHIDFKRCWGLENLQLLPARENKIKSNKLTKPFQPTLKITLRR